MHGGHRSVASTPPPHTPERHPVHDAAGRPARDEEARGSPNLPPRPPSPGRKGVALPGPPPGLGGRRGASSLRPEERAGGDAAAVEAPAGDSQKRGRGEQPEERREGTAASGKRMKNEHEGDANADGSDRSRAGRVEKSSSVRENQSTGRASSRGGGEAAGVAQVQEGGGKHDVAVSGFGDLFISD